ncbi:G-patch domain-containing protein [Colletotrichum salicis]|uniref:PinX1-related protein 1 n=1 Tax=Colletotrichum salicis TaxID=1209931 RepID=A0A135UBI5_9PEZI|nr:G-patch domain-containing protein [Colletotrichum salicis]
MGLAQAKTRRKIGKDPNNTKWTKDLDSFGQKILRSQGWEPGQYLGAKDAAHAVHHTAANASFIRVALKDDMLGLGFKQARDDRVTGMDVFSDLLGRLNGKSTEVIAKEQEARTALKSTFYCDNKFGPMRFVSGGFLVGDKIKEEPTAEAKDKVSDDDDDDDDVKMEDAPESSKRSKKRKAEESSEDESSSSDDEKAKKKRRKEEKKGKKEKKRSKSKSASKEDASEDTQDETTEKKAKKDKKKSKKAKKEAAADSDEDESSDDKSSKKKRKGETDAEKAARKEEKKRRKEEKRAKKEAKRASASTTPTVSGTSTPVLRGHHAVRSRWIAQKRMATMDDKALNAIFMVKSQS